MPDLAPPAGVYDRDLYDLVMLDVKNVKKGDPHYITGIIRSYL